jgi:DNA polymerase I
MSKLERIHACEEAVSNLRLIMDPEEAREFLRLLGDMVVALDFETTGLDPVYAKVRLSCIYHPTTGIVLLDHFYCGSFGELVDHMLKPMWAVYNAKFEVRWFDHFRPNQVDLIDVDFLAKSKMGGGPSSLAMMVKKAFFIDLDKSEQNSDWSQMRLSPLQLQYAAADAFWTYQLYAYWMAEIDEKQKDAAFIFQDAVRATIECEDTGMDLDTEHHEKNIKMWQRKQEIALRRLRHWTNDKILPNPGSDMQVSNLLKKQLDKNALRAWPRTASKEKDQLQLSRPVMQPIVAKSSYPFSRWGNALLRFRYYRKYLSTYGETLLTKQYLEDRISFRLNIAQAGTGRYSSSSINIQNIPRNPGVRKAFLPPKPFDWLIVADYSGIEIRVLAELSGDTVLLQDAIYGDVHSGSASAIYGYDLDEFRRILKEDGNALQGRFKEMRSKAKGFTFQNIYGAAALALSIVLKCSVEEAEDALRKWAQRYPKAYNYRHVMFDHMSHRGFLPLVDGRTIFVNKMDRTIPVASNYGVQGAAASVMYRAMYHVHRLREERSNRNLIRLVATVHDELLLAAMDGYQELAKEILVEGMILGWLDIFPGTNTDNLVEAGIGKTWGTAKK